MLSSRTMESDNSFLPHEIMLNILKRLPVKSLIRFKCVCKHWQNLFKTPSFINEHLQHSTHQNPFLLFCEFYICNSKQLYLLNVELNNVEVHCTNVLDLLRDFKFIGSSNGLLCYHGHYRPSQPILLCNPAIRDVRLVETPFPDPCDQLKFGFGFNSIVNDYKVIRIACTFIIGFEVVYYEYQVDVYSLKTKSWKKKVESSPLDNVKFSDDCFVFSGSIFWFGYKRWEKGLVGMLISFDMAMEVFTLIPSPITPIQREACCLNIHENKLALFSCTKTEGNRQPSSIELWVMEDEIGKFGERLGWTKKFSFRHSFPLFPLTIWRTKMVCVPSNSYDNKRNVIVLVNLTTSEVTMFDIRKFGMPSCLLNHVESLVPVSKDRIEEL